MQSRSANNHNTQIDNIKNHNVSNNDTKAREEMLLHLRIRIFSQWKRSHNKGDVILDILQNYSSILEGSDIFNKDLYFTDELLILVF